MKVGGLKSYFFALLAATPILFSRSVNAASSAPTTAFDGQNFTIAEPVFEFKDNGPNFDLEFRYATGKSITADRGRSLTLYRKDCEDTSDVDDILGYTYLGTVQQVSTYAVSIKKAKINDSNLVEEREGGISKENKGSIKFCVKFEGKTLVGTDTVSVSFLKTKVSLDFDLTDNVFTVTNNNILADSISSTNTTVDTVYEVKAFRCGTGISEFADIGISATLNQNALVAICVEPETPAVVKISTFNMFFKQGGVDIYTAATLMDNGPNPGIVSRHTVSDDGDTHKITSRLISNLFKDGGEKFDVEGDAYLEFATSRFSDSSPEPDSSREISDRLLEDTSEGPVGESPFSMTMSIEKVAETRDIKEKKNLTFPLIGSGLVIAIAIVVYKKLA